MSTLPIADYALLSDCRSAALRFPRFDGPSVFARLLDERAGHWSIRPAGEAEGRRRYIDGTMALQTTFQSPHRVRTEDMGNTMDRGHG